jgi:hypothetical protein
VSSVAGQNTERERKFIHPIFEYGSVALMNSCGYIRSSSLGITKWIEPNRFGIEICWICPSELWMEHEIFTERIFLFLSGSFAPFRLTVVKNTSLETPLNEIAIFPLINQSATRCYTIDDERSAFWLF